MLFTGLRRARNNPESNMKNPFVAGSWVRGKNFFGRDKLIREILDGRRNAVWVAGTRRLGKTSLLKQIELLTSTGERADAYIPLFWDMQGSADLDGLKESLLESVEDAEERFEQIGIDLDALEEQDLFATLRALRRRAREHNRVLLLLCDEAEELINIEQSDPRALPKLRRMMQRGENTMTVLTATRRLSKLESSSVPNTSPFLHGFVPPVYLAPLDETQARKLIGLGGFSKPEADEIIEKSNNHPYLIQLICRRLFEARDLETVVDELCADDMIAHFFSVDFQYLEHKEKEILLYILQNEGLGLSDLQHHFSDRLVQNLYELAQLGFIRRQNSRYKIANYFFKKWLEREKEKLFTESTLKRAVTFERQPPVAKSAGSNPAPGDTLGQHEILEELGRGGMGMVFKGRDSQLERLVALKVLSPELAHDAEFRQRFVQEARAASVMNHPNIATLYQIGEEKDVVYISMEYVDGENLRTWRTRNANELNTQLQLAIQVARALAHAHNKKIVHRDVKSDNILVTQENTAKIMDFGLAKTLTNTELHLTRTGTTLGTLSYMSPEQASGLNTDHRTDIFSFGVVLYELFSGRLPFAGDYELSVLYAILNEDPTPLLQVNPNLPEALQAIVTKAMQKDKTRRFETAEQIAGALEAVAANLDK